MFSYRQKLEEDPDNAAAQAVIERGAESLDAQEQLAQTRFNKSMENLPDSMREGAAAAMAEARNNAAEDVDPEAAAMEALAQYVLDNSDGTDLNPEDLAALQSIVGAAGDYLEAAETADRGADIVEASAEAFDKSDLAAMKANLAARLGVSPDQLIVLSGTDDDDEIFIDEGENGGLRVTINDKEYNYTAEEAKYLIIDGGAGSDEIRAAALEQGGFLKRDLHLFGGAGDDAIYGGDGYHLMYGGAGDDKLYGGNGTDEIYGGAGNDVIYGFDGNDIFSGGAGVNSIVTGTGTNVICDDGEGCNDIDDSFSDDVITVGLDDEADFGIIGDVIDTKPWKAAFGVKKCTKGIQAIYQGGKVLAKASKLAGVAGGAISVCGGLWEAYKGIENGDGWQIAAGGFQTVSGGLAIAAACCSACPPVAAGLWIASGACALVSWFIDLFR